MCCANISIVNNKKYDSRDNCNAIIDSATNMLLCPCVNTIIPDNVFKYKEDCFSTVGIRYYSRSQYNKQWLIRIPEEFPIGEYNSDENYYDISTVSCGIWYCRDASCRFVHNYHSKLSIPGHVILVDENCKGSVTIEQGDLDNGTSHSSYEYIALLSHFNFVNSIGKDIPFICDISNRQIINVMSIDGSITLGSGDCAVGVKRVAQDGGTNTTSYTMDNEDLIYQMNDTITKVYKKGINDCVIMMSDLVIAALPDDITDLYIDTLDQMILISKNYCMLWNSELVNFMGIEPNSTVKRIHFAYSIKTFVDDEYAGKAIYSNFKDSTYNGTFIFDEGEFALEQLSSYSYE